MKVISAEWAASADITIIPSSSIESYFQRAGTMADIFETRCVSDRFAGSNHLLRVACFGDSMVWGQGVMPRQTLPAHLMRSLNAALPDHLVWVDNFGLSSGNVWQSWTALKWRARNMRFDAVVFCICQNDSQIFEHFTVSYARDKAKFWDERSVFFRHATRVFEDFGEFWRAAGIPALVVWYSFLDSDRPSVAALRPLLQKLGITFIDMIEFYRTRTAINADNYRASEFDGHPSSEAHELAARSIAMELLKSLGKSAATGLSRTLATTLVDALRDLVDQHVPVDSALDWARESLAAKQRAARRRHRGVETSSTAMLVDLGARIVACESAWRMARRIETCTLLAELPEGYMARTIPNLYRAERVLDEAAFILERCSSIEELSELSALFDEGGHFDQADRLAFFSGDPCDEVVRLRDRLNAFAALRPERMEEAGGGMIRSIRVLSDSLDPTAERLDLAVAFSAVRCLHAHLATFENVGARLGPTFRDQGPRRLWAIIFHLARQLLASLERIDRMLAAILPLDAATGAPWTCVEVTLESGPDREIAGNVCLLQVEADYVVPQRFRRRETNWAGLANEHAVYRFELPIMFCGCLRVGVNDKEPARNRFLKGTTRIVRIDIFNASADGFSQLLAPVSGERHAVTWACPDSRLASVELPDILLV
jgi:hypothetical protein